MRFPFGQRRHRARDEALAWLARLRRGLRQAEGPQLLAWLERRSHRIAIAKAAAEWHGPEALAVLSEIFPIPAAIAEPRRRPRPPLLTAAALAGACITLAVPVAMLMAAVQRHVYATAPQAIRRLTLEDGTRVELNRGTEIHVTYAQRARSVLVTRGEALFEVASQPDSPFYIHAGGRNFETRAATFDIRFGAPGRLSLTVLQGTVTVFPRPRPGGKYNPTLLEPLQMLVIDNDGESGRTLTEENVRSRLAWQRGT